MVSGIKAFGMGFVGELNRQNRVKETEKNEFAKMEKGQEYDLEKIEKQETMRGDAAMARKHLEVGAAEAEAEEGLIQHPLLIGSKIHTMQSGKFGTSYEEQQEKYWPYINRRLEELKPEWESNPAFMDALAPYLVQDATKYSQEIVKEDGTSTMKFVPKVHKSFWDYTKTHDQKSLSKGERNGYMKWAENWMQSPGNDKMVNVFEYAPDSYARSYSDIRRSGEQPTFQVSENYYSRMEDEPLPENIVKLEPMAFQARVDPTPETFDALSAAYEKETGEEIGFASAEALFAAGAESFEKLVPRSAPSTVGKNMNYQKATPKQRQIASSKAVSANDVSRVSLQMLGIMQEVSELKDPKALVGQFGLFHRTVSNVLGDLKQFTDAGLHNKLTDELKSLTKESSEDARYASLKGAFTLLESFLKSSFIRMKEAGDTGTPRISDRDFKEAGEALSGGPTFGFLNPLSKIAALETLSNMASRITMNNELVIKYGSDGRHKQMKTIMNKWFDYEQRK